jgi:hypothetical protein
MALMNRVDAGNISASSITQAEQIKYRKVTYGTKFDGFCGQCHCFNVIMNYTTTLCSGADIKIYKLRTEHACGYVPRGSCWIFTSRSLLIARYVSW